ncbi:SpoIIE family protein phosphatase [Mycolicibacterium confluentis]|uniref:SpoIIE family protein phosphatase n=1 Tax=Mycolicibacterium confluentis TaxID=28047 RepID=UPI000A16B98D|nr:SpoIIE family protein phosphatase [Mycolicibacterium confluentis]MCV7319624.1 SpoIIE family protein phosphatase [Mycolicibacterium confluentis]ORV34228.1 histidine kinase [Mycolicibacterium confluentis]
MSARDPDRSPSSRVFADGGEVGRDLGQVDWDATPLGPPQQWPQSLQAAVGILLSSRFPMWMAWGPDLTFFCNDGYRRATLGEKYPWALGRPARDVWAEIWDDIGWRVHQVLDTGQATWDTALLLLLKRSGYIEETYHTFSYSPLRDDDGRVVGMLCVVSEDTDRVIGERRMSTLRDLGSDLSVVRNEEEILAFSDRQLSQNLRDLPFTLTYLFDDDGNARLAGTSGVPAGHAAAPDRLEAGDDTLWPVRPPAHGETVLVDLDEHRLPDLPTGAWPDPPTHALVVPLQQQGGSPSGFLVATLNRYRRLDDAYRGFVALVASHVATGLGLARSYQLQQRRAEELTELDRAKTTFFSNISHEFRTPLTLILDPVDALRQSPDLTPEARQELDVVWRNGLRLAKLVNSLLDFSRIEAGRGQAAYHPVDIGTVTADLASVFRSAVDRAGLSFEVDCPPLDMPVHLDLDMWEKVIFNLLSNALKFTCEGSIAVTARRDGDAAVIEVADTGIGVPEAEQSRLFERFYRIENVYARSNEGSGIGLALVKELVGLHGGTIDAVSAENEGTTFTIRVPFGTAHLPAAAVAAGSAPRTSGDGAQPYIEEVLRWLPSGSEPDNSAAPGTDTSPAQEKAPQTRILVADDNADMREYLARLLRSDGYRVDTAVDGREALEAVRADVPHLLISDVMMPRMDGLALVSALRADRRTALVPVLLLSARAGQEESITGLAAGADDYLVKPFTAAELLARARAIVHLARLRDHQSRWRAALVDSLQEAFFLCDEHGSVIEINAAFTEILGYDASGLPYEQRHPWWPSEGSDPDANRQSEEAFRTLLEQPHGILSAVPVIHRDGHRMWVTATFNHADDPDTGRRVTIGTLRDVTADHYQAQRETALAALSEQLAQAETLDGAVLAVAEGLQRVYNSDRVLAVTLPGRDDVDAAPSLFSVGDSAEWADLAQSTRATLTRLSHGDLLVADTSDAGTAGIALQHPRGVLVIYVELRERRAFTPEERTLLTVLAGRLGQGLQRVHLLDQQRETALALQHAILGPAVSSGFAVRYQPASRPLQVGGDWYDVVNLDDGRIGLVVGDCVGHGLSAATVMGQLRSACRALLLEHLSPAAALAGLDRFAMHLPGARCTTVFCGVLDPESGELVYSCAGHPPPILVHADLSTELLEDARAIPLGLPQHRARPEARVTIRPRATLVLYTDGLVERRRESLDDGIARAVDVVQDNRSVVLDGLAKQLMANLAPHSGYQDDVALLLYRQPAPLELEFASDAAQLAGVRTALRGWLQRAGVGRDQALDVLIATGEAIANAIEHGHRDTPGTVCLRATAWADRLKLTVIDTGRWVKPQPAPATAVTSFRGRGISLMRALMQDIDIEPDHTGTTVHLNARIA